jgi:2-desacetyl-2-hydroxyethyl bacteriochlorophyllide A dehydrogenase
MKALIFDTSIARLGVGFLYTRLTGRPACISGSPLRFVDVPERELPGADWVRVRTRLGGICGSDLHMLHLQVSARSAQFANRQPGEGTPSFPGHETVGEVVEVGRAVSSLQRGQRVVLIPGVSCATLLLPPCEFCRRGLYALCRAREDHPVPDALGGGWSERFLRHESQLFPIPDDVPDEIAVLFEPVACSLHGVLRRPPRDGERVLVVGAGMIGLGVVAALRALRGNFSLAVLARHGFQAERAHAMGADNVIGRSDDDYESLAAALGTRVQGRRRNNRALREGFDLIYDTVGSGRTLHHALRWTQPRGSIVLIGVDLIPAMIDQAPIWLREISVHGVLGHGAESWDSARVHTYQLVCDWHRSGRLPFDRLLSYRFPVRDYRRAIETAASKSATQAIKVALDFSVV